MSSRGPSAGGVRAKPNNRIQFDFTLDGVRYRPTIRRASTTQNLLAARVRLTGIRQRIRAGTFFFDQEFPEYRFLGRVIDPSQVRTCDQVFDQFIAQWESRFQRDDLAWVTVAGYRRVLNSLWSPRIGALPFLRVDYVTLARVTDAYRCSRKTFNNSVSVLRRAFEFGYRNHPHHINPALGLRGCRMSRKERIRPDPFRIGEAEHLIAAIREDWGEAQASDEFRFLGAETLRADRSHRVRLRCDTRHAAREQGPRRGCRSRDDEDRRAASVRAVPSRARGVAPSACPARPTPARRPSSPCSPLLQRGRRAAALDPRDRYAMGEDSGAVADPFAAAVLRASFLREQEPDARKEPALGGPTAWPQRAHDARGLCGVGRREAGSGFSVWHWIWHQERGACT